MLTAIIKPLGAEFSIGGLYDEPWRVCRFEHHEGFNMDLLPDLLKHGHVVATLDIDDYILDEIGGKDVD